ncbi:family 20 glycosylhydrolase [Haploplasma axanthum]|uniref:N-acetyl-beta-hexosaminidase n=1 Tax=Haploplasma axanthum TaxID=29552 RepID=A0A449BBE8_HAPAX|nr:family 20 glycosylhydrolase [Haploplasma axanthum]VEU79753.1 N-acetyl-beta-hexosaminidase [Haploplasma axanthum]
MKKAIEELNRKGILIKNNICEYIKSDETKVVDNKLYYKTVSEGLVLLINNKKKLHMTLDSFGTMLDLSRGAVFKLSYIKELIYKQALMGVNQIWLYIEDVYELDGYPTFGYMRGRYTKDELKAIIEYAEIFEIEIVPSIQVLGHHGQFLRWPNSSPYKDQSQVLIVEEEKTYALIKKMIEWAKSNFKTNKIHVGMDETFGLGFGAFYKKNGYKDPMEIFTNHLNIVNEMALKEGFKEVMIWSDMFFRFLSPIEYYYDSNIVLDDKLVSRIPENVTLVYWDYYNHNDKIVSSMLKNHVDTKRKTVFASGTWVWTRFSYDKYQTDRTAKMHLKETLKTSVKDFILTQWMDDGAYADHKTSLLGVYEISCDLYFGGIANKKVFKEITNDDYNIAINKTKINETIMSQVGLLWDDPLLAIYLNNFTGNSYEEIEQHIVKQNEILKNLSLKKTPFEFLIMKINLLKLETRKTLLESYENKELNEGLIKTYQEIIKLVRKLNAYYQEMWYGRYKTFGLEVVQSRLGTQIIRFEEMIYIVKNYQKGDIIDVLEEKAIKDQYLSLKYNDIAFSVKPF